jgi:uncharacterized protein
MTDPTNVQPANRSLIARLFLTPDENRLRAGWRLLVHLIILWLLVLIFTIIIGFLAVNSEVTFSFETQLFLGQLAFGLAIFLSVYIARGYFDRRTMTSLGLSWNRRAILDLVTGVGIALVMFLIIFTLFLVLGWLQIDALGWQTKPIAEVLSGLAFYLALFILIAFQEELLARGYWLQNIAEGTRFWLGFLLSSVIFAVLHFLNPGSSWASTVGIFAAGLFLAFSYAITRQLWLPIGLHFGWNFFEGPIFGFPVSGLDTGGLISHTIRGPELITGGVFGPEAGLIQVPAMLVGLLLIWLYARRYPQKTDFQEEH